jgi:response regulator RpfG family c-di-GMP phosphodiesterase
MKNRQPKVTIVMADDNYYDILLCHDTLVESRLPIKVYMVINDKQLMAYLSHCGLYTDVNKATLIGLILVFNMRKKEGFKIIKSIKNHRQHRIIPVIFIGSFTSQTNIYYTYNLDANSLIQKPVNFTSLFTSFTFLLEEITTIGEYWFQIVQLPI